MCRSRISSVPHDKTYVLRYTLGMRRRRAVAVGEGASRTPDEADRLTQLLVAARRDPEKLGDLFTEHYPVLLRSLVRVTFCPEIAADLAAETFAVVVRDMHRFDPARGSARAWIGGIAKNQVRSWLRRGVVDVRARERLGIVTPAYDPACDDLVLDDLDAAQRRDAVREALGTLTDPDREVLQLRVIERRPYDEIAASLGCSVGAARVRASRALARLRGALDTTPRTVSGLA